MENEKVKENKRNINKVRKEGWKKERCKKINVANEKGIYSKKIRHEIYKATNKEIHKRWNDG